MKNNKYKKANKELIDDEFYTRMEDIEAQLPLFKEHFKDKIIYLNCDDSRWSNFYKFFYEHFIEYGIKKVIATCFCPDRGYKTELELVDSGDLREVCKLLNGNGDFRSEECLDILKECDLVVTNPPFSLYRDFVYLVYRKYHKNFITIAPIFLFCNVAFFSLIIEEKIWFYNEVTNFITNTKKTINCFFSSTIYIPRDDKLEATASIKDYKYDFYDDTQIIDIPKMKLLPNDYYGTMGVPITFLVNWDKWKDFEIFRVFKPKIKRKSKFARVIIRRVKDGI